MANIPPNPSSPAHRQRAYRLKKILDTGGSVSTDDAEWFANYEQAINSRAEAKSSSMGGSRSHRVEYHEETAEAVGMGEAASVAASAALAREEGKRLDTLVSTMMNMMVASCQMYEKMAASAMGIMERQQSRAEKMEDVHLAMLDAVRDHYLARVDAEAELAMSKPPEEKDDMIGDLARGFVAGMTNGKIKIPGTPDGSSEPTQ